MDATITTGWIAIGFGLVSSKWALDLGYSQTSQLLILLGGFIFGPLVLLILYIRLINTKKK